MKSVGDTLSDKLKSIKVSAIATTKTPDPPKPTKENKMSMPMAYDEDMYYDKPCLHLDNKDFPGVKNFTGGKEIYIAIKAKVENYNSSESVDKGGVKKERTSVRLEILEIADLTDLKGGK